MYSSIARIERGYRGKAVRACIAIITRELSMLIARERDCVVSMCSWGEEGGMADRWVGMECLFKGASVDGMKGEKWFVW